MFFNTMILGTLITASAYSWFSMWMGLEINLLSIIPLFSTRNNVFSSESSLKYFITQAMASLILLMSVILLLLVHEFMTPMVNFYLMMTLNSSLLTKLGAAPFHFWFPEVMEGLNWLNCLILLTWQKIAPMILIMNNNTNAKFLVLIILICLVTSTTMGFNQISLRKILTFSSINHIAWMLSSMFISYSLWMIYFIIYCLISINIIVLFSMTKSFYLSQLSNVLNYNKTAKFTFMLNFLSLGGLPPFIGFLPKWLVINWLVTNNFYSITFIMIIFTLIMLYIYMRVTFTSILLSSTEPKILKFKFNNFTLTAINLTTLMSLIVCTMMLNFY